MRRAAHHLRRPLSLLALLAIGAGLVIAGSGCGSSSKASTASTASTSNAPVAYDAAAKLQPAVAAPPLSLRNYLGQRINLDSYRGKAVLVTFIYTKCPDVCPLITSNLRVSQNLMGKAKAAKAQIIAVSVDPRGDTPKAVKTFLAHHEMTGRMQYLVGSASELARVWKAWGVGSKRDVKDPDFVEHSGLIYGITGSGKRTTLYAADFRPADIVHDVPLLAAH
jgi:protein SCO1/2